MNRYRFQIFLLLCFQALCCQKSKIIDLDLPPQTPTLSVECYLERGKITRMLLTETSDYYSPGYPVDISALVTITHNGIVDTMLHQIFLDTIDNEGKVYNYYLPDTIKANIGDTYSLYIKDSKGRVATAQTVFRDIVKLDSVYYILNENDRVSIRIEFLDDKSTKDQYRLLILKDTIGGSVQNDMLIRDEIFETATIGFNTTYKFNLNDSLYVDLYHLTDEYYTFLKSVSDAKGANGNPFAVPAKVKGNITGGIGIFQALNYDRRNLTIRK